jgi:hypothetical protein
MKMSRTIRFIGVIIIILSGIFVDTLFFGIFYPSDGTCDVFTEQTTCTALPSKISSKETQCTWDEVNLSCAVTEPPSSVVFIVIISLITSILTIPIVLVLEFILENYAIAWPAKKGFTYDIDEGTDGASRKTKIELREAENKSMFGEVIMYVCMIAFMYVYVYVCMYVWMYIYKYIYIHMFIFVYIHVGINVSVILTDILR